MMQFENKWELDGAFGSNGIPVGHEYLPWYFVKSAQLVPWLLWKPVGWVRVRIVQAYATSQKETPLCLLHSVIVF